MRVPYQFSPEQIDVGNTILRVASRMGATPLQIQAAFLAAWTESRMRNLSYGDRDSLGVFQQRPSQGWGSPAQILNVEYAAGKFFEEARRVSQSGTPGQLAQRVQRSAFPGRYDALSAEPLELLGRLTGGALAAPSGLFSLDLTGAPNLNGPAGWLLLLVVVAVLVRR